ncbi:MAG: hypothetical protein KGJ90_00045 [Patescibacteria group bacterium]|nr:hypothetical protein [Patescibacteria group bacterium]
MEEQFIPIADIDAWEVFIEENFYAILEQYESFDVAFELARNQCLMLGGGAAPLFRIGFVD